ncbi:MAG: aminotransferase class V-fold PLP-dependent enzyme [Gemmatimonadota bacterium]|nr:aminotransferase class V-fold PLP-dependent enzyme [Gemmatimonadota bacterium]
MMLDCRRADFRLEDGIHYLNCAYLGPLPRRVEEAGIAGIARKRSPTDFPASAFYDDAERLRARFGTLIGGPAERVAIVPSVSYAIASAARNIDLPANGNIVVLGEQFPSNVYIWRRLAAEARCELRTVERPGPAPSGLVWNDRILDAIDRDTAVVALAPVHWTDGTRFDLIAIGARARDAGAVFIVDASQSVGAVPFDVREVRPDLLVSAAYKWMLGPYSMALAWFGPRFDGGVPLEESWMAREGSDDFQALVDYVDDYAGGAVRYDMGERANFIQIPMMIEALDLIDEWQPARILAYNTALLRGLAEELRSLGWPIEDDTWRSGHMLGVNLPEGMDLKALHARLEGARVYASLRGQALRVSPHVYNDAADIAALREVLLAG